MKFHGDWLPEDMVRFREIEEIFRRICLGHGYGEVRTPVIEKLHWFTGAGILSPELMHKVYTFLDWDGWSGERVVLRPDNTVPVCRLFSEYFRKKKKAKVFYVEDVFRYDEKEKIGGRHCQVGVELLGDYDVPLLRDTEVLLLIFEFLKKLKIGRLRVILSHAGILHAYLKTLNLKASEEEKAFELLMEGQTAELRLFCADRSNLKGLSRLLELRGSSSAFLKNLKSLGRSSRDFRQAVKELETITAQLEAIGHRFEIFPGIHKDLTYYTGVMFDVELDGVTVGGGGRYDRLLEKFTGKPVGGCGFSIYVEPLMGLMGQKRGKPGAFPMVSLVGDLKKPEIATAALKCSGLLRSRGLMVELFSTREGKSAGAMKGEIKKAKTGLFLVAQKGRKKERFPLPLKGVKKLVSFWEIER